jgi:Co/Zn/Cd efflux system component
LDPIDLKTLGNEQRRRLMLAAGLSAVAFVVALGAGALSGSQALKADALDFAAMALAVGLSFWTPGVRPALRVLILLGKAALLVLLGGIVALGALYAFFVRGTPEPALMSAGAVVALAANGTILYLLRGERVAGALHGIWLRGRNDLVGSGAVLIAAGVVVLVDNSVPDLTVAGVIVVLFMIEAVAALRRALSDWEGLRTQTQTWEKP